MRDHSSQFSNLPTHLRLVTLLHAHRSHRSLEINGVCWNGCILPALVTHGAALFFFFEAWSLDLTQKERDGNSISSESSWRLRCIQNGLAKGCSGSTWEQRPQFDVEVYSAIIDTTKTAIHVCEVLRYVQIQAKTDKTAWADSPQTIFIRSSAFLPI